MTKKQKQSIKRVLFGAATLFAFWIIVFFNIKITENTATFVINQNEWVTSFVNNFTNNAVLYISVLVALFISYFVLIGKRK